MEKKSLIQKIIINILPFLFVFIASLYRPVDPDLGWHLKYGEYFFEHGKPLYENTFSTEMADFLWPNISWGTDVITYALYSLGGFLGLILGGALVVTLTFFFFSKAYKLDYWEKAIIFPFILYFLQPIISDSFRGQLVSLALLGILFYIVSGYEKGRSKFFFFLPFLFLLWANIHGLFLLGLGILILWQGLYLASVFFPKKQIEKVMPHIKIFIPVALISTLVTLVNPFGLGIHQNALSFFNNPVLKYILEYLPPEDLSIQWYNLFFTAILGGVGITAFLLGKKLRVKLPQIGIFGILFILSLWVKRYAWAMYYTLIAIIRPIASFIRPDTKKGAFWGATFLFVISTATVSFFKYPFGQFRNMNWGTYCRLISDCSPPAAETLRKYYIEGETMTLYNWGGWLIWNYPDLKPSVDGRMHLWRDETGYSAFEHDYYLEQNLTDIDSSKYNVVFTSKTKPIYERLRALEERNLWEGVYEDITSAIFVRKSAQNKNL